MTSDASWQVQADALQARGDPRGAVMAIQTALERAPDDPKLRAAEREALAPLLTGPLKDALARLEALAGKLAADPNVVRLAWEVRPPVSERELLEVEAALGVELHESIRTFYRQTNGLSLFAQRKDADTYDAARHVPGVELYRLTDDYQLTVAVHLGGLKEVLLGDWSEQLWFDWMTDDETTRLGEREYRTLSFSKSLRVIDSGNGYYPYAFALITDPANPLIALGDDYGATFADARHQFTFEQFMLGMLEDDCVQEKRLTRFRGR
jgi:hypothetical protein